MSERLAYRVDEVADMLGLAERTIRMYVAAGDLPAIKLRRRLLIRREDLEQFLAGRLRAVPA